MSISSTVSTFYYYAHILFSFKHNIFLYLFLCVSVFHSLVLHFVIFNIHFDAFHQLRDIGEIFFLDCVRVEDEKQEGWGEKKKSVARENGTILWYGWKWWEKQQNRKTFSLSIFLNFKYTPCMLKSRKQTGRTSFCVEKKKRLHHDFLLYINKQIRKENFHSSEWYFRHLLLWWTRR